MPDKPEALPRVKDKAGLNRGDTLMSAKRTGRNLLAITAHTLDAFPGIEDYEVVIEGGKIVLTPVKLPSQDELDRHFASLNLTEEDIKDAVAWARAEMRKEKQAGHAHSD